MKYKNFILDRFQEEAIQWIDANQSVIVSAPTGAGKTVIAEYAIEKALAQGRKAIYTSPIKALSNQKFRDFSHSYPNKVGIMTGDVTLNADAPVLIMTTEIFRNALFEDNRRFDDVLYLILDEIHYIDDAERGSVWEESLIFAPFDIQILCLSATVPNVQEMADWISRIRNTTVRIVSEEKRPVPLMQFCLLEDRGIVPFEEARRFLPKKRKEPVTFGTFDPDAANLMLEYLHEHQQMPCLYFVFSRKECEAYAYQHATSSLLNSVERKLIQTRLREFSELYKVQCSSSEGIGYLLCRGIGYHHAGMLPAFKELIEQLFTDGLIKVLFATETFALGVNMPASSVVFSRIKKYDGISVRYLKSLEYQQMSGRAGRRGLDNEGYVYGNLCDQGVTRNEVERVLTGLLEPISSQFNLSYSTLLSLYERVGTEVIKTWDKSFGAFQRGREVQKEGGKKGIQKFSNQQRTLIKKKLSFLRTLGYINDKGLTTKGRFATFINGYEVQVSEAFYSGLLENHDEVTLFVLLVALVFESKKTDRYSKIPKPLRDIVKKIEDRLFSIHRIEAMFGIEEVKIPDFNLSAAAMAWAKGCSFRELMNYCTSSPGDIVRSFRLAVQVCRQLRKACSEYREFVTLLDRCLLSVNRDEINALKQMEAFNAMPNGCKRVSPIVATQQNL